MYTLFVNLYVLLTWGPHMVYHGDSIFVFHIHMLRCGWLGNFGVNTVKNCVPRSSVSCCHVFDEVQISCCRVFNGIQYPVAMCSTEFSILPSKWLSTKHTSILQGVCSDFISHNISYQNMTSSIAAE